MKKLTKTQEKEWKEACEAVTNAASDLEAAIITHNARGHDEWQKVEAAIADYNNAMGSAWKDVAHEEAAYNEAVGKANEVREAIAAEMRTHYEDKSDKWRESDDGQAFDSWASQWEQDIEDISIDEPDELDLDQPDELDQPDVEPLERATALEEV